MALISWSLKRQLFYIFVLLAFISVFGYLIIHPYFNKAPSCMDGKQNGDEMGIDCGGSCALACMSQVDNISILWARAFQVIPGRYNAVAYLVNHNKNDAIEKIGYRFRFADKDNIYIGKRDGSTFIPPGRNFAIFEPGIDIGNSIPVYTSIEFTTAPVWIQVPQTKIDQLKVLVSNINLENPDTAPHLSAVIKNNSLYTIPDLGVIAILYDAFGNAVSVSRTYLSELGPLTASNINFTWPAPFPGTVVAKELIPMYDVFSVKLR